MSILELARRNATLAELTAIKWEEGEPIIRGLIFSFGDYGERILMVNPDDNSLIWRNSRPAACLTAPFETVFPQVKGICGLRLIWAWEMRNQQGYFDAFQFQFADESLKNERTLQFLGIASQVQIFEVVRL